MFFLLGNAIHIRYLCIFMSREKKHLFFKSLSFKTHKYIDQLQWFLSKITGKHAHETANWNHHSSNNWDTCLECNTETLAYTKQVFV